MEVGIFSRTYQCGDLEETYRRMTADGIRHTQLNLANAGVPTLPETVRDEEIARIRDLTKKYGIRIDAVTGTFNMIDPDEEARRRGCRQFAVQCRVARDLGIPVVTLCTGSRNPRDKWKWHDDNLKDSSWDILMRSTEAVVRCAQDSGVFLGVETEASNIINTPVRARKYLRAAGSDRLKIIMDGANLFVPEQVPYMREVLDEAFALLGDDIVLAHAKDFTFDGGISFAAAGKGIVDFAYYVSLLRRAGYDGALILHGLSEREVPESRRFLEGIMRDGSILS